MSRHRIDLVLLVSDSAGSSLVHHRTTAEGSNPPTRDIPHRSSVAFVPEPQRVRTFRLYDARTGRRYAVPAGDHSGGRAFNDSRLWCYRRGRFCRPHERPDPNFVWTAELQRAYEAYQHKSVWRYYSTPLQQIEEQKAVGANRSIRGLAAKVFGSGCNFSGIRRVYIFHSMHCWDWKTWPRILGYYPRGMRVHFEFREPTKPSDPASIRVPYYRGIFFGNGGRKQVLEVGVDDDIAKIDVWTDASDTKGRNYVTAIRFHLKSGIVSETYGVSNQEPPTASFQGKHPDSKLVGVHGRAGGNLTKVGFTFATGVGSRSGAPRPEARNDSTKAVEKHEEIARFRKHFWRFASDDARYLKTARKRANRRISEKGSKDETTDETTEATSVVNSCHSLDVEFHGR